MNSCSICNEISGQPSDKMPVQYAQLVRDFNNIIDSYGSFHLLPSIGALNDSHLIIVPIKHYLSLSCIPQEDAEDLSIIKATLRRVTSEMHDWELVFFEHGVGFNKDSHGASIDHAHLHVIRHIPGLIEALKKRISLHRLSDELETDRLLTAYSGYVLFEDTDEITWIAQDSGLPSQFFRFVYADVQGSPDEPNWREDPRIEEVKKVISVYRELHFALLK